MPENTISHGKVNIGKGTLVQDNVILGSRDAGVVAIGENSLIRSGAVIYSDVKIGKNFRTGHNVLIRENTEIGNDVLLGTNSVIDGNCKIGNNVSIQTNAYITAYTIIEDNVFLGPCSVTTNDKYMVYGSKPKGPTIKKGAKIGANSTIFPGIIIGEGSIIGAGAVITRDVAEGDTVIGNPARSMKLTTRGED